MKQAIEMHFTVQYFKILCSQAKAQPQQLQLILIPIETIVLILFIYKRRVVHSLIPNIRRKNK